MYPKSINLSLCLCVVYVLIFMNVCSCVYVKLHVHECVYEYVYIRVCVYVCESLCRNMNEENKCGAHSEAGPSLLVRHWVVPGYLISALSLIQQ